MLKRIPKLHAQERLEQINIISFPHMDKDKATSIIDAYKHMSGDISDLVDNDDYSNLDRLKGTLNGG